ncbi:MAG: hypothetical protein ACPGJS_07050 [Flammeovirgaceae bacterium]
MINDLESANFQFELTRIDELLTAQGYQVQFIKASQEILLDMLIVDLPDPPNQTENRVIISFIPLDSTKFPHLKLIQLHASSALTLNAGTETEVKSFLLNINNGLALGSFALGEDNQLYFRQVIPLEKAQILDHEWFLSTFSLFLQMFHVFSPLVFDVNAGLKSQTEALQAAFGN